MGGRIGIGVGGWTYEPWRGVFYPAGLSQKRELAYASRALSSIEINGTYYSTFGKDIWRRWHDETPDDFIFSVKASRYATNRRVLAEAGQSIARFLSQGLSQLGSKLGPINWQFIETKRFEPEDFNAFLALLPREADGLPLRHAVEVRHPSFASETFYEMARRHHVAIVYADGEGMPKIDEPTAGFTYARLMTSRETSVHGLTPAQLSAVARRARAWANRGDVFIYFIRGAKVRNPAAAEALIARLSAAPARSRANKRQDVEPTR